MGALPTITAAHELIQMVETYRRLADDLESYVRTGGHGLTPTTSISEWALAKRTIPVLIGRVSKHPTIKEGRVGVTTEIVYLDIENHLARSMNRWYRLGSQATLSAGLSS